MLISDCMTRHPVLIPSSTTATEAQRVMTENSIRHLPVVESGKRMVGLLTRSSFSLKADALSSLNVWEISRYLGDLKVSQIMVKAKDVVTITADRTAERAAAIMAEKKIGCLPVVDNDNCVIGIVTENDLLRVFQELLGLAAKGVRVTVRMPNRTGEFVRLMAVLAEHKWGVWGVGTYPARKQPDFYHAVVKIGDVSEDDVRAALSTLTEHEIIDIRSIV
ncbi:MAG: CBS and ACT domain-containing protein [Caldilineaceae bacterium]